MTNHAHEIADLYADTSAVITALIDALQAKGLLSESDVATQAAQRLKALEETEPHTYLMLRTLAEKAPTGS